MKYGNIRGEVDGTYQLVGETYIDGAYAQYKMDEDAANTTVDDSGYGANGATSSTNTSNLASSGAFDFTSASSEYVNIDNLETDIINDTVGTFSCWVNPDTVASLQYVWCFGDTNSGEFIDLSINASGNIIFETSAGGWKATGGTTLSTGTWYHIVTGQDGSAPFVYINGVRETLTFSFTTNIDRWFSAYVGFIDNGRIGCRNYQNSTNQDFYDGQIDDLRYYKYPLTGAQVTEIYNSGTVDEDVVMTEPTQTIEFTGLDGDNDEEYELYVKHWGDGDLNCFIGTASGYLGVYGRQACYVLADTSPSNLQSANTSNGAFIQIGNTDQGEGNWSVVNIQTPKGLPKSYLFKSAYDIHDDTSPPSTWLQGGPIDLTLESNNANITRIKVISSLSGGLQEGTHVILMKKVNNDAMKVGDMEVNGRALTEPPDPYAYYKLNETSGTTTKDFGYGANDGTASTDASGLTTTGIIDRAYDFTSASSEYVNLDALATDIASDTTGTIAFWSKPVGGDYFFTISDISNAGTQLYVYTYDQGTYYDVYLKLENNNSTVYINKRWRDSTTPTGQWLHTVLVQDGSSVKCYMNGVLATSVTDTGTDNSKWMSAMTTGVDTGRLGCLAYSGSNQAYSDGEVEDFRYYKYALEADQAEQLYKLGVPDARATVYGMWEKIKEVKIDGPYAHFKLEEDAANTTVNDSGSGSNNGTANSNTSTLTTTGKVGNAFLFEDANPDYVSVSGLMTDIKADTIGTICAWMYSDTNGNQTIFSLGDISAADTYFQFRNSNGALHVQARNAGTFEMSVTTAALAVSANTWTHVAAVCDGISTKMYINGEEVTYVLETGSGKWIVDADDGNIDTCYVGNLAYSGSASGFDGKLDDVRYYQRALTPYELLQIYNEGNGSQSAVANQVANSINFTGLDGDTDTVYKLIIKAYRSSGGSIQTRCKLNSDANSNYQWSYIRGENATASASQSSSTAFYLGANTTTGYLLSETYIYTRSGRTRPAICSSMENVSSTTVDRTVQWGEVWWNIGDNITNILLEHSTAGQFYNGSSVELWRLNLQESY